VLADSIDDEYFCGRFLTLLDLTEQTLKQATEKEAQRLVVSKRAAWDKVIHGYGILDRGELQLPLQRIMSAIRIRSWFPSCAEPPLHLYSGLVEHARNTTPSDFAVALLLELMKQSEPTDVDLRVKLLEIAARRRLSTLWVQAVQMIQSCTAYVMEKRPDAKDRIVNVLEEMLRTVSVDWMGIMETLSAFGAMEPPVSFENACEEFRKIARGDLSPDDLAGC
jgi:hypothetical protein